MGSTMEKPFREVRARKARERPGPREGRGDCHCGMPFLFVAIKHDGQKRFYWCTRCDIARGR